MQTQLIVIENENMFIASLFIILGLAFFLRNAGLIPNLDWDIIWPLILIWIGVYMLLLIHKASETWDRITKIFKRAAEDEESRDL